MRAIHTRFFAAMGGLALMAAACGDGGGGEGASVDTTEEVTERPGAEPRLAIASPAEGASVKGNVVTLDLEGTGVRIAAADGDRSGATGHYHLFVDREPPAPGTVIPREPGVVHTTDDPVVVPGLAVGTHRFVVVYGDGTHARLGTAQAGTTVKVEGPSVDASAPAASPAGQPVTLAVKVEGLTLVKADGDRSGRSGHLHFFVDREPTPAGQPIPVEAGIIHTAETTVEVPNLAAGEHTIWVVAGDGAHVPLDPKVMDKLTVTVA